MGLRQEHGMDFTGLRDRFVSEAHACTGGVALRRDQLELLRLIVFAIVVLGEKYAGGSGCAAMVSHT
jgi:hypothetical protein